MTALSETFAIKTPDSQAMLIRELSASPFMAIGTLDTYISRVTRVYQWSMGGFQIDLWIPEEEVKEWRFRVAKWMQRLEKLRTIYGSTKPIHFICVPLDVPRRFPEDARQCLGREHVNGGYTYVNGHTVYLFRKEELSKVLLHEYLHQIQGHKDAEWVAQPAALEHVRKLANIPHGIDLRPNEAIVEAWALRHHTKCLSEETGIPFKILWDAEVAFACSQARRVWMHQSHCVPRWNEGTHTFSYYILKAWLVWAWEKSKKDTGREWSLNYTITELIAWIQQHWPTWQTQLESGRRLKSNGGGARMTLFGDW
jgi:hypothetical protein